MRKCHTSDDCVNPKRLGDLSRRNLIIILQRTRRVFGRTAIESGISRFLTNRGNFFWIYLIASDHPLTECLEALHFNLVDVFSNILYPEIENDVHIYKEKFMEAMQTHNLAITLKVHVLVHHVP